MSNIFTTWSYVVSAKTLKPLSDEVTNINDIITIAPVKGMEYIRQQVNSQVF